MRLAAALLRNLRGGLRVKQASRRLLRAVPLWPEEQYPGRQAQNSRPACKMAGFSPRTLFPVPTSDCEDEPDRSGPETGRKPAGDCKPGAPVACPPDLTGFRECLAPTGARDFSTGSR